MLQYALAILGLSVTFGVLYYLYLLYQFHKNKHQILSRKSIEWLFETPGESKKRDNQLHEPNIENVTFREEDFHIPASILEKLGW